MRKLISILLALILLTGTALADESVNPADLAMIAKLLPGCKYVKGIDDGSTLRLLMRTPADKLVFVGGVQANDGTWAFTESTPLPEGASMDAAGGLIIPTDKDVFTVGLHPYADGTWGLSRIDPGSDSTEIILYKHVVIFRRRHQNEDAMLGDHPWSDVTVIDWTSLPASHEEACAALDTSHWAIISSPDPLACVRLRSGPSTDAETLGGYYNRTPVYIREAGKEWCAVTIGGVEGWMMTRYLVNGANMRDVPSAAPYAMPQREETMLHVRPSRSSDYVLREMEYPFSPYVLGKTGYWYHVWLQDTEEYGYVHADDLGF